MAVTGRGRKFKAWLRKPRLAGQVNQSLRRRERFGATEDSGSEAFLDWVQVAADTPPASSLPFVSSPSLSAPRAPSSQGGYSLVPNLLLTTLAAVAVTNVPRAPVLQNQKQTPQVQAFQAPNLLTETLGTQPQAPVGDQQTASAPPPIRIGAAQQNQSRALLDFAVQPIPIGSQQVESAPTVNRVLYWDKGTNTLLFTLPIPVGKGQIDSAPIQTPDVSAEQTQSRAILEQAQQPIPIGEQRTESQVETPRVQLFTPEQILPPVVTQAELPPGRQSTDSSPPTPRIGDIKYARGVDPGAPAPESGPLPIGRQETDSAPPNPPQVDSFRSPTIIPPIVVAAELPIGDQKTDSAPYTIFRPLIDEPQNLLAGPLGLQPVASSQSEGMPTIRPSQVFLWLPPNVTINLPVVAQAIPVGEQRTETQVTTPAVTVFTPPQIQPPVQNPLPVGEQRTDSAPIPAPAVQSYTAPVIIPPISGPLPVGGQRSESAPIWAVPIGTSVGWTIPPDLLPPGIPTPPQVTDQVTGGWPMYYGRKRIRQPEVTKTVTEIQEDIQQAKRRLEAKKELRRQEKRAKYVTEEIRQILDEQDRLKLSIEALRLQLKQAGMEEEEILLILALAG